MKNTNSTYIIYLLSIILLWFNYYPLIFMPIHFDDNRMLKPYKFCKEFTFNSFLKNYEEVYSENIYGKKLLSIYVGIRDLKSRLWSILVK